MKRIFWILASLLVLVVGCLAQAPIADARISNAQIIAILQSQKQSDQLFSLQVRLSEW